MFAAIAALTFASCDNNANKNAENADSAAFSVENFSQQLAGAQDSAAVVGLMDQANAEVQALFEKGDTVAAQTLIGKIKEIIETNKDKLAAIAPSFANLANDAINVPESLKEVANGIADSTKAAVADKANEVVDAAKDAVEKKANEVVDKAAEKVNEGANKAAEAANKSANDAKAKAADAASKAINKLGR